MTVTAEAPTADLELRRQVRQDRIARLSRMIEIRALEERIVALFSEGLIHGTTHTCQGQEAVAVGLAAAAEPSDWVSCTYRGHGHALALGATVEAVLGEVLGRTCGSVGGLGGSMHLCEPTVGLLPTSAIVGAGIPIAVGAALTASVLGTSQAAVAVFGDGSTNIGAFHESLNLASIWRLPVVFVCENNLYGEYSRIDLTTPLDDLAERAASYAMPSFIVDGQDVDAVTSSLSEALDRARSGGGPTFLEMKTYRYCGHSRSDAAAYRPPGELESWRARDPIQLYEQSLTAAGVIDHDGIQLLHQLADERIAAAEVTVRASEPPDWPAIFAATQA